MLKSVPDRFHAGNCEWDIKLKYNEVESKNKFDFFLYCSIEKNPISVTVAQ